MSRNPKIPQYQDFNRRYNCFGQHQLHDKDLDGFLDSSKLMLEIGAGTASLALEFANSNQDWQVIALDLRSDRLNKAAKVAEAWNLANIAFVQSHIKNLFDVTVLSNKVDLIWITFPDPWPKKSNAKRRLTAGEKLGIYHDLLKAKGILRLKTDNQKLFDWSINQIKESNKFRIKTKINNLHQTANYTKEAYTITKYEQDYLNAGIDTKYLEVYKI